MAKSKEQQDADEQAERQEKAAAKRAENEALSAAAGDTYKGPSAATLEEAIADQTKRAEEEGAKAIGSARTHGFDDTDTPIKADPETGEPVGATKD